VPALLFGEYVLDDLVDHWMFLQLREIPPRLIIRALRVGIRAVLEDPDRRVVRVVEPEPLGGGRAAVERLTQPREQPDARDLGIVGVLRVGAAEQPMERA